MLCALALTACDAPSVSLSVDTSGPSGAQVVITGLSMRDTSRIRVSVLGETTPIVGRFSQSDGELIFTPTFPFDRGRDYEAVIGDRSVVKQFRLAAPSHVPSTRVTRISPTAETIPENQLRLYVEFSAPMSREGGLPYVKLLDADGNEVKGAFLPLDADFWDREHRRYTLFLDPGRVKRGILPNDQMGRALIAGRRYMVVVDSSWRDGRGQPLVASYRREFRAGPADYSRITPDAWRVHPPRRRTRAPLEVEFNEPLDRGLLLRALGVERLDGSPVDGDVEIGQGETTWRFTPRDWWQIGNYRIVVLDFLEDMAGNRINRAFEVDLFQRADSSSRPSRTTIPFRVR